MELYLQISNQTGVPAYRQIMEQIGEYQRSGVLKADEKLPSIRMLAKKLAVNPGTVVKAYHELEHGGVIYSQHGKGVFVAPLAAPGLNRIEREQRVRDMAGELCLLAFRMSISAEKLLQFVAEQQRELERSGPRGQITGNQRS